MVLGVVPLLQTSHHKQTFTVMKNNIIAIVFAALWVCVFSWLAQVDPVNTAITYQGRLTDGANPANGTHEFEFYLFDAATNEINSTVTRFFKCL